MSSPMGRQEIQKNIDITYLVFKLCVSGKSEKSGFLMIKVQTEVFSMIFFIVDNM